ncbi:hypothetical protein Dfulv_01630 [Dactylosporangium fulvum]|uniref:Uncharacterized protein n=1 Tax=Dactylosporangium fulvum TaxID=53359 RepID=A0ABY5W4M3_9ACTN|nr:hypothetical protein [Dactylosporangium fulvum]UWP83036.1 hypothetical protein Dfulv_01630 [Dactylosporangium fulvum]
MSVQPGPSHQPAPQPFPQAVPQPPGPGPWTAHDARTAQAAQLWQQERAAGREAPQGWQPRIEPSSPKRGRLLTGLLVGLFVGLVVFAPAGYFVGDLLFGTDSKSDATHAAPSPSSTGLPAYEATQAELNRKKFEGDLAVMAEPWLPYLSRCVKNGEPGTPKLPGNEQVRITCQLDNMAVYFVQFKTAEDRSQEFLTRKQQNVDAQQLAPGASTPTRKAGASGKNDGNYVEFAFKPANAGAQTYVGIWWDRDGAPLLAARIEAAWVAGLDQKWEPLRDIWQRRG